MTLGGSGIIRVRPNNMKRPFWLGMLVGGLCLLSRASLAGTGNTAQLTLSLIMEQTTCDVNLLTPATISFPSVPLAALEAVGHIVYPGTQTVTVGLSNCAGSAKAGAVPAIQVSGNTPITENPKIFREYSSTAGGNVGFGIRYEPTPGQPQDYLSSGDFIDLGAAGSETTNRNLDFLVDMLHGPAGDTPTSGSLLAKITFQFMYH